MLKLTTKYGYIFFHKFDLVWNSWRTIYVSDSNQPLNSIVDDLLGEFHYCLAQFNIS
jgi:hypothetical protein